MVLGLPIGWEDIPGVLAALGFIGFSIWVFALDPGSRLYRAFSLLMLMRGLFLVFVRFGEFVYVFAGRMAGYFALAEPFAAVYFALVYREKISGAVKRFPSARLAAPFLLAGALFVEGAYVYRHDFINYGFLLPVGDFAYVAYGVFALVLARQAVAEKDGEINRNAAFLISFGFVLEAAYQCTWQTSETITELVLHDVDRSQYLQANVAIGQLCYIATIILCLLACATILRHAELPRTKRLVYAGSVGFAMLTAVPLALAFAVPYIAWGKDGYPRPGPASVEYWIGWHFFVGGLWMLASLLVIGYTVLRHRLVNMQWKLRVAVRGTTLAGIFIAVLFILSEASQIFFQQIATDLGSTGNTIGSMLSVVGAGVVVFALHPVQRFAERLAHRSVPDAKPIDKMSAPEKLRLYREQAELAWLDGQMQRKERILLDALRERLGLPLDEATRIERAAMDSTTGLGLQNRSLTAPEP